MTTTTAAKERPIFIACWSAKGGQGTTTVATHLALQMSQRPGTGALLVDLAGDVPSVLGCPRPDGPGVADWLPAAMWDPNAPLAPIHMVTDRLSVVPRGHGDLEPAAAPELVKALARSDRHVVVDCGTLPDGVAAKVAGGADRSLLVTRPCQVALLRALQPGVPRPDGIVVINEPGRALTTDDVSAALLAPVLAEVPLDAQVARLVDAGLLAGRLARSMRGMAAKVAGAHPLMATAAFDHLGAVQRALGAMDSPSPGVGEPGVGAW